MKWLFKEPSFGDIIRVKFSDELYHYGIFVSDDEVIQFGLAPNNRPLIPDSEVEVLSADIDAFLAGGFLEVGELDKKEKKTARSPEQTVEYARSKIGTRGYNLLYNNCEHFANDCLLGRRYSSQADDVRAMFRSMPVVDVYFAEIPSNTKLSELVPAEREREIADTSNERVKREKYYAWRLLEYALERSLGFRMKKIEIKKQKNGKWTTPSCEFSISHSGDAVAVAVSRAPVGIDIEPIKAPHSEKFAERVLTENEFGEYSSLDGDSKVEYLIDKWTAKEATFKSLNESSFIPSAITVDPSAARTGRVVIGGTEYSYSVATKTPEKIKIFENISLEKY